jgi:hypothetical protein
MHKAEIARLLRVEGVDGVDLDFGVNRKNGFLQSSRLPPELLRLAGEVGVGVEVSIYGEDDS